VHVNEPSAQRPAIFILNRDEAARFSSAEPYAIVGITDPELPDGSYVETPSRRRLLRTKFHDIRHPCCSEHQLFDDAGAKEIADFARWFRAAGLSRLVIHCEAGVSRSSATALAIGRYLGLAIDDVIDPRARFRPNPFVLWRLTRELMPGEEGAALAELYAWFAKNAPELRRPWASTVLAEPAWVGWGRELATMSQNGLTYSTDPFDIARYERIREIATAMLAAGSGADITMVRDLFACETGHATPKVDVRAFVVRDGRVLLVRERREGRWSLPGGWADVGETPREAVEREVFEEAGFTVRTSRLLALYDKRMHAHPPQPFYVYKAIFACEITAGEARAQDETDDVGFFAPDALPELSRDRILPEQIARLLEIARDPAAHADLD
jgi:ADP-ribose pyrophosphatase YjhB (NUDIX family)